MSQRLVGTASLLLLLALLGACAKDAGSGTESATAERAYQTGLEEMRRFRMPEAVGHFESAIAADSSFAMAHLELARCFSWVGRTDEIESEYAKAFALRSGASPAERLQIEHGYLVNQRDFAGADSLYALLATQFPNDIYTLSVTARRQWRDLDFQSAARSYRRILEEDPSRVDVHNLLGYLHLEAGDYEEAIQCFQRYVYYAPNLANPHDSLGDAYTATGQYEDAITQYWAALEIDQTFVHSWGQLAGVLIDTGQLQQAASILDKTEPLFAQLQQSAWSTLLRLRILYAADDWAALATACETALAGPTLQEQYAQGFALNASALRVVAKLELGDLDGATVARDDFERRLQESTKGGGDVESKSVSDQARLARFAIASRFARARGDAGVATEPLANALRSAKLSPHQLSPYHIELAKAHLQAGEPDVALEEVESILRVIPTHPEANLEAARILAQLGRAEDVLRHLGIYLEVMRRADPGFPDLREAEALAERYAMAN